MFDNESEVITEYTWADMQFWKQMMTACADAVKTDVERKCCERLVSFLEKIELSVIKHGAAIVSKDPF